MKKLLLLLFCLGLFTASSYAQSSNSERIKEIQTELDKAVENSDFEKAAKLKKERDIRLEIETAIEAGDFDKAAELKAKLKNLDQKENQPAEEKQNSPPPTPAKREKEMKERNPSSDGEKNYITKNGFYMEAFVGFGNFQNYTSFSGYNFSSGSAIGVRLGNKMFFGKKGKDIRMGLDMNWGAVNATIDNAYTYLTTAVQLSVINPGFTVAKSFTPKMGMEVTMLIGPNVIFIDDETTSTSDFGFRLSPQAKFRLGVFTVGMEYCYGRGFIYESSMASFGGLIGFKF